MSIPLRLTLLRLTRFRKTLLFALSVILFAVPARLVAANSVDNPLYGCPSGSGTCFDTFAGAAGRDLGTYNPNWVEVFGTGAAHTTGTNSAAVGADLYAYYAYAPSHSETSQITIDPSTSPNAYTRDACVRISSGASGYCVGFGGEASGVYENCYIEKSGQFIGSANCGAVSATTSHTLAITASGTSTVTLAVYLDNVYTGSVTDSNGPFTIAGSGFSLQGGVSDASSWHDFRGATASATPLAFGCVAGSGSCIDTFAGTAGTPLSTYNSNWQKAAGASSAFLSGSKSVETGASNSVSYYYVTSQSDSAQISIPASTKNARREACVRMQEGVQGYCVSLGQVSNGLYLSCPVTKGNASIGTGNCASPSAQVSHTLAITASGTSPVTLHIYLDGISMGSVVDNAKSYAPAHPGFALVGDGTPSDSAVGTWMDSHDSVAAAVASAPIFSPAAGTYTSSQTVTISSVTPGPSFFYTTDGSTPTTASKRYTGPITVAKNTTLKAVNFQGGETPSAVSTAAYTIAPKVVQMVVQTPLFSYAAGAPSTVNITDPTVGANILYCVDTANTCTPSQIYTGAVSFTSSSYVRAQGVLSGATASPVASWQSPFTTLQISTSSCPSGTQYQTYQGCTISATGGLPPYVYGWSTTAGNGLVEGLQLSQLTGAISGTVYGQGTYDVTFTVTDLTNTTVSKTIPIAIRADNTTGGCSLFPPDTIWHLNVSGLPVDTSVAAPILPVYQSSALHMVFGSNLDDGGIPFLRVPYNQQNVPVQTTVYQSYFTSGPFPSYAPIEGTSNSGPNADRHVPILQTAGGGNNCRLWEMWQGAPTSNGWTDSSNAYWDLGTYAMLPQGEGSTDAAGLPILPLLWNYDEVAGGCAPGAECGVVKHPARLTLNHTLNYHVWPATAQSGLSICSGGYEDDNHLISQSDPPVSCGGSSPMGEIYRLKSSTATPAACVGHPQAQVLITALRNYGLIVADNGITGGIVATADARWNDDDLACLTNLHLSDFEPVNVSGKMMDINSSQVRP